MNRNNKELFTSNDISNDISIQNRIKIVNETFRYLIELKKDNKISNTIDFAPDLNSFFALHGTNTKIHHKDHFVTLGFLSTTTSFKVASYFTRGEPIYYLIEIPINFPYMNLKYEEMYEILLPIGTIIDVKKEIAFDINMVYADHHCEVKLKNKGIIYVCKVRDNYDLNRINDIILSLKVKHEELKLEFNTQKNINQLPILYVTNTTIFDNKFQLANNLKSSSFIFEGKIDQIDYIIKEVNRHYQHHHLN
jgi:hypothetical protein